MYIIQEIQTDVNKEVAFMPPVVKATQQEAESEYYIKLGYAAISNVSIHSVIMYTEEGFPLMHGCYKHDVKPEPTPEPTPEPDTDTDVDTDSEPEE